MMKNEVKEVRIPIQTIREGNKITKVCVEDVYKIVNRVTDSMDKAYNNATEILESISKEVEINGKLVYENEESFEGNITVNGELIVGTGISQPCMEDAFDEEIGNNIAFMKAKLNASLKKRKILLRVFNQYMNVIDTIDKELDKINHYIDMDLDGIRKHNPDYLCK